MSSVIYIEEAISEHPRTKSICDRYPNARIIFCDHYGEIFNRKAQNFRLQKNDTALILAKKNHKLVLEAPAAYGIGGSNNYYFSHMLNCLYDCRYCFLQGMYRSAYYVVFVNFEDFQSEIDQVLSGTQEDCYFFSGYDCDSLAMNPVTQFVENFLPFFSSRTRAWLELRTKSTQIRSLLDMPAIDNCIVAYSLAPNSIVDTVEHRTPSLQRRLEAIAKLQLAGWKVGLRFDPLIYEPKYRDAYKECFNQVFDIIDAASLHSVSLGTFRMPSHFFDNIVRLYPDEPLFSGSLAKTKNKVTYQASIESELMDYCSDSLLQHIPGDLLFPCPC